MYLDLWLRLRFSSVSCIALVDSVVPSVRGSPGTCFSVTGVNRYRVYAVLSEDLSVSGLLIVHHVVEKLEKVLLYRRKAIVELSIPSLATDQ